MRSIRSKDTAPELRLRSALHKAGYRFTLHHPQLPGRPDIVLPRYAAVVEVRGCFWHGHTCPVGHVPKTNSTYWAPKLQRTKARDARNVVALQAMGYEVRVVWECEIGTDEQLARTLDEIAVWLETKEC